MMAHHRGSEPSLQTPLPTSCPILPPPTVLTVLRSLPRLRLQRTALLLHAASLNVAEQVEKTLLIRGACLWTDTRCGVPPAVPQLSNPPYPTCRQASTAASSALTMDPTAPFCSAASNETGGHPRPI